MRKLFGVAAGIAALTLAGAAMAQTTTMRISHQVPTAHHLHKMLENFAADVDQRSGGQVKVQLFPAEQAYKAAENHPAVARGAIEGALVVNQQWGNTIPEMNVVVIPYFFSELEKIKKFPGSEASALLERKLMEKGVRNLAWFYITRQAIVTSNKAPIINPQDFKGVKIRGFNKLADEALLAVGAAPSALSGNEVYNALQTGVLDAGLTDVSAGYSRRYYEVQKYGTVGPYITVYFHLFVNPAWWDKLPAQHRTWLEEAAKKGEQDSIPLTEKTAADAVTQLKEKGMAIHIQTQAEIKAWIDTMQKPVMDAFIKASPTDGPKLIELMNKL